MNETEEAQLIAEIIAQDKSLTDSQRSDKRCQERMDLYATQLNRQLENLTRHVPSFLMALTAYNNYRVACALWPEDMSRVLHDKFIEDVMRSSNRCRACQKELPMPYDHREYCDACNAEFDAIALDP